VKEFCVSNGYVDFDFIGEMSAKVKSYSGVSDLTTILQIYKEDKGCLICSKESFMTRDKGTTAEYRFAKSDYEVFSYFGRSMLDRLLCLEAGINIIDNFPVIIDRDKFLELNDIDLYVADGDVLSQKVELSVDECNIRFTGKVLGRVVSRQNEDDFIAKSLYRGVNGIGYCLYKEVKEGVVRNEFSIAKGTEDVIDFLGTDPHSMALYEAAGIIGETS